MSEGLFYYGAPDSANALYLDQDPGAVAKAWSGLRSRMIRRQDDRFTREEWAYLITFLDAGFLESGLTKDWGGRLEHAEVSNVSRLATPRGKIAVWLPNNVSLLGPLTLIQYSILSPEMRFKAGSGSENLVGAFMQYALEEGIADPVGQWLQSSVSCDTFGRDDPRNAEMALWADVRVVFGSDQAAASVRRLPYDIDSLDISFGNRQSQIWANMSCLDSAALDTIISVFSIYGQTGCTSPKKVVIIGGTAEDARIIRQRLCERWARRFQEFPPPHVSSENLMAAQVAAAQGWSVQLSPNAGAVFVDGSHDLPEAVGMMTLPVVSATLDQATASLPDNIQTIGYALPDDGQEAFLRAVVSSGALRFVPMGRMHHFGSIWDGWNFLRMSLREIDLGQ